MIQLKISCKINFTGQHYPAMLTQAQYLTTLTWYYFLLQFCTYNFIENHDIEVKV